MKILGLCGGSGSGKGVACSYFAELGLDIIDTDSIYHQLISKETPCFTEIVDEFGIAVLNNGSIDRKKLAGIVFSSKDKRLKLNSIAHKHILISVRNLIETYKKKGSIGVIVDAPLLFESGFDKECDATLCILSDDDRRISRIMMRDSLSEDKARERISAQKTNEWLAKRCDYSIENNASESDLRIEVARIATDFFEI